MGISGGAIGLMGVSISGTWRRSFDGLVGMTSGVTAGFTPAGYLHQIDHGLVGTETSIWRGTLHLRAQICELYKEADLLRKWRGDMEEEAKATHIDVGTWPCRLQSLLRTWRYMEEEAWGQ